MVEVDPVLAQLKGFRQRRCWSLNRAAVRTGIPAIVLGSYERGQRQPPLPKLRQWAEGLGLRLSVIGGPGDPDRQVWVEHAVEYGDGALIACDTADEAHTIADQMPAGRVVRRQVHATRWNEVADIREVVAPGELIGAEPDGSPRDRGEL